MSMVGLILLLVFVAFATLMFLERLSALLALPLMAISFLVVAVITDLMQPAAVTELVTIQSRDSFGRQSTQLIEEQQPSRFAAWQQSRLTQHQLLTEKARLKRQLCQQLSEAATAGDTTLRDALIRAREQLDVFEQKVDATLSELPRPFAWRNAYPGQLPELRQRLSAITIGEHIQIIANTMESQTGEAANAEIAKLLGGIQSEAAATLEHVGDCPDAQSREFQLSSGCLYILYYLFKILRGGALHLAPAIIATIFGGMFAMYVKNLRVAERLVLWTAEFAGEQPFVVALAVYLATSVIFTSVGGLGTVIMLGTIILPILRSIGLSPVAAAGVFLIGLATGGTLDPVSRRLWMELFGIPGPQLNTMLWTMVGLYLAVGLGWIWWGTQRGLMSSFQSQPAPNEETDNSIPPYLMAAPLIPVGLVYFGGVDEIAAFVSAILYMFLFARTQPGSISPDPLDD
jgi:hypothetical protein